MTVPVLPRSLLLAALVLTPLPPQPVLAANPPGAPASPASATVPTVAPRAGAAAPASRSVAVASASRAVAASPASPAVPGVPRSTAQAAPAASTALSGPPGVLPAPPGLRGGADHPWVSFPIGGSEPENYLTNLRDGDRIETPFVLKFGLSRFGLAGISQKVSGAGHHHLLVDQDLPLDFSKPLPFNEHYIHFGKGQMEGVLNLAPGPHTLRLLLADHRHIPYFIYSKPIRITVTRQRGDVDAATLIRPGIALLAPQDGERVRGPFRVQFHASGFNVGHMNIRGENTGHFVLTIKGTPGGAGPVRGNVQRLAFINGWTETWLKPPAGRYTLELSLVSNSDPYRELAVAAPVQVVVER